MSRAVRGRKLWVACLSLVFLLLWIQFTPFIPNEPLFPEWLLILLVALLNLGVGYGLAEETGGSQSGAREEEEEQQNARKETMM